MRNPNNGETVAGSKTGIVRRTMMQMDGSERGVNRTGVFKRDEKPFSQDHDKEADQHREPPAPPTLPEVNQDDGGTTGMVNFGSEGTDSARREDHPQQ